ncbi:MAG: restriction endonuclease [Okeania sp. SIO2H7]|nr:restriction endonuclease [Okeania sp. SIO2H7]
MLDKETRQLINKARTLGSSGLSIFLEDSELLRLCAVAALDLNQPQLFNKIATIEEVTNGYYGMGLEWFQKPVSDSVSFEEIFYSLQQTIEDFATYFKVLCELHKRRLKFKEILENQPIPELEQIVPRCLLEYGLRESDSLASWLVWRKWLYDIDNRSAQETGYLFEPILTAAIGGVSFAASKSPVKRSNNPNKGRQVDCIDGKLAYEFKMRMTIAASGQGRFQEELDFARDCAASGYTPILLVLDSTPSSKLADLIAQYSRHGGRAYIGDYAWNHLEKKAGTVMGNFIKKYVRQPLEEIAYSQKSLEPIYLVARENNIVVTIGDRNFSLSQNTLGNE